MTSQTLTKAQKAIHDRLNTDFFFFADRAPLMIQDKESGVFTKFKPNKAQRHIHSELEKLRNQYGFVRAIIMKGRQQGCSTYIGARFFWKVMRNRGRRAFIMAHDSETTQRLFKMSEQYLLRIDPRLKPSTSFSNRKELIFDKLEGEYRVGTAGSKNTGRGGTVHLFHGSEAAFWENPDDVKTGAMQQVPRLPGTEVIIESTANGMDPMFYPMAQDAIKGIGDYKIIFVPWYWQDEYTAELPEDFEITDEEREYQDLYKITAEQIFWRRLKIQEFGGFERGGDVRFKQEYPANIMEAFQTSGSPLINPNHIMKARKAKFSDAHAPIVMGVDPGRTGDKTAIVLRRGREFFDFITWPKMDQMELAGIVINLIKKNHVDAVFIDAAEGSGTVDRCHELGFTDIVKRIPFGMSSSDPRVWRNKRTEIWCEMADAFAAGVSIPDSDEFHKDLVMVPDYKTDSSGIKWLIAKEIIKKLFGSSPNIGDAAALTYSFPVRKQGLVNGQTIQRKHESSVISRIHSKK